MLRTFTRGLATQAHARLTDPVNSIVHLPLTRWPASSTSSATSDSGPSTLPLPASTSTEPYYVTLPSYVFEAPYRPDILHQCVVAHLASLRQGTAQTKNRAMVRGSGKKIMRQKGTGKARVGDSRSPIRRGGGRAFPKIPKDWMVGLNRKVWEMGVRTALSERWRRGELSIIPEAPSFPSISTRNLALSLRQQPDTWEDSLFLVSELDEHFALSARNLPGVEVRLVDDIDVYSTLQKKRIILDVEAVQFLQDWLGAGPKYGMEEIDEELSSMSLQDHDGQTNPDGGVKEQDVVIEQEEAPIKEKRHDEEDPLKNETSNKDEGDQVREEMEELSQQQSKKTGSEDSPSLKDVV